MRLLIHIDTHGPQTFSELIANEDLKFSRNTVNKYLKLLREKKLVNYKYENDKKINYLTTEGKIQVEKILGKDDLAHHLKAYLLIEKKIKKIGDEFLLRFGELGNSLLIDCVENFVQFEQFDFDKNLPSDDFKYKLAFYVARFNLQYKKSKIWLRTQPTAVQYTQSDFCEKFEVDMIEIKYFCQEWNKIKGIVTFFDESKEMWFLSPDSLMYQIMMTSIMYRSRRGSLQELLFENFIFNLGEETSFILNELRLAHQLELDMSQLMQFQLFIQRMLSVVLKGKKGYSAPWLNLPPDVESLQLMSIDLETELSKIEEDSPRRLEIYRTLHYIESHLVNHDEAFYWGEKYLKLKPDDLGMLSIMALYYYSEKRYPKFLELAENIRVQFSSDILILRNLIEYHLEVNLNLSKAMEYIEEMEQKILSTQNLKNLLPEVLIFKTKRYLLLGDLKAASYNGERAWHEFGARDVKLFKMLVKIYKTNQDWEVLEDFCEIEYYKNEYNPFLFEDLYFAHLKRHSFKKANRLFERIEKHYPDYVLKLEKIKSKFSSANNS